MGEIERMHDRYLRSYDPEPLQCAPVDRNVGRTFDRTLDVPIGEGYPA